MQDSHQLHTNVVNLAKHGGDLVALSASAAVWATYLPPIAAFFSIVWTVFRIVEMLTGKPIHKLIKRTNGKTNA